MTAVAEGARAWGAIVLGLVAWLGATPQPAAADDAAVAGFDLCVRPLQPPCVGNPASFRSQTGLEDCRTAVSRYMALTIAYRQCLTARISDAILHLNDALDHIQCGAPVQVACSDRTGTVDPAKVSRTGARRKP